TLGVRRGSTYHLKNSISGGVADQVVTYGRAGDDVLVGDWDGDGRDTLGVHRGNVFYAKNTIAGGAADVELPFGRDTETALAGDWAGDGVDTPGVRSSHAEPVDPSVAAAAAYDARMIELINEERRAAGVPPVTARPALRPAALRHSTWMAKEGVIQHAPRETIAADARAVGCTMGGEHIVRTWQRDTRPDPQDAMDWYMGSEVHRSGILNPNNTHVAVGTVKYGDRAYNTQRFVRGCSAPR